MLAVAASACRETEPAAAASAPPAEGRTDVAAVTVALTDVESALQISGNLFERGALPRQRLDTAATGRRAAAAQRDLAQATLAQVQASLRRAREVRRDATLTSPVDGVIVERHYDAGSLVGPGDQPVVVVADLRVLTLEAGVSELEAGRLRAGLPARVTVQARASEVFDGRVAAIAPEVDARNRHFRIEVRTANPGGVLLSGMYATATIPLARAPQVPAVPREAVATRDGTRVALRIEGDTITEVPVTEGVTDGRLVQITAGLQPGDVVVSDARQDVAPGAKVNPIVK